MWPRGRRGGCCYYSASQQQYSCRLQLYSQSISSSRTLLATVLSSGKNFCRPVLEHYELEDEAGRMFVRSMLLAGWLELRASEHSHEDFLELRASRHSYDNLSSLSAYTIHDSLERVFPHDAYRRVCLVCWYKVLITSYKDPPWREAFEAVWAPTHVASTVLQSLLF